MHLSAYSLDTVEDWKRSRQHINSQKLWHNSLDVMRWTVSSICFCSICRSFACDEGLLAIHISLLLYGRVIFYQTKLLVRICCWGKPWMKKRKGLILRMIHWISGFFTFLRSFDNWNSVPSAAFSSDEHDFGVGASCSCVWSRYVLLPQGEQGRKGGGSRFCITVSLFCYNWLGLSVIIQVCCVEKEGDEHLQKVTRREDITTGYKSRHWGALISSC